MTWLRLRKTRMANAKIDWKSGKSPEDLSRKIGELDERIPAVMLALGQDIAVKAQNRMRNNAPWTDHTGQARAGLRSLAQQAARDIVIIYLVTSAPYGKWLELAHGQRFRIIMPTIEEMLPEIESRLKDIFR